MTPLNWRLSSGGIKIAVGEVWKSKLQMKFWSEFEILNSKLIRFRAPQNQIENMKIFKKF